LILKPKARWHLGELVRISSDWGLDHAGEVGVIIKQQDGAAGWYNWVWFGPHEYMPDQDNWRGYYDEWLEEV
jgi:hypothetical protein